MTDEDVGADFAHPARVYDSPNVHEVARAGETV